MEKFRYFKIEENDLILLLDSWLNYQIMLREICEDEIISEAKRRVIKANWPDVPEEFAENTVMCAEHMVNEIYKEV